MEAATATAPPIRRSRRFGRVVPDERLVQRVREGDEGAFESIYDRHHAGLLAFCRHMLGNREEAEDALQHVFVAAHKHLRDGDRDIQLRPWLYTIARNRCFSMLRARRASVALEDVAEPEAAGLAVAAQVEQRQDLKDLLSDMSRLPDEQRAALVLSELGALSHEEIADALDVRKDKVKALVFQARESLIGWREARGADCQVIREQLATLTGGGLRRAPIRRHLDTCDDCRAYREEVRRQRAALAAVLPVVPSIALKQNVLTASLATGGHAGALAGAGAVAAAGSAAVLGGTGGGGLAALGSSLAGKGLAMAAVAGGLGGGYVAVHHHHAFLPAHHKLVVQHRPTTPTSAPTRLALSTPTSEPTPTRHAARHTQSHGATGTSLSGSHRPAAQSTPVAQGGLPLTAPLTSAPATEQPSTNQGHGHHHPVPVRRGPASNSKGVGPPPFGTNRGRHRGLGHRHKSGAAGEPEGNVNSNSGNSGGNSSTGNDSSHSGDDSSDSHDNASPQGELHGQGHVGDSPGRLK
jgi:RNA polymerase sigma factor (sigma-70 family)